MIRRFANAAAIRNIEDTLTLDGIDYEFTPELYSTISKGHPLALVNYQYYPNVWTVKDKSFLCWNQRDGAPYNNADMVLVFDHITKLVSQSFDWGTITPPDSDVHLMPTIIGTRDNKILMLREDPHIGPIHIRKSGDNYNVATYTSHGFFHDKLAYPHIHELLPSADLFCFFRESGISGGLNEESGTSIFRSSDNGETWLRLGYINYFYKVGGVFEWSYPLTPYSKDGKLRLLINRRRGVDPVSFPYLYYVESLDGVTWSNKAGTFSKNITTAGEITTAELDTNCIALQLGTGAVQGKIIRANGAIVGLDGEIYCIGGSDDASYSLQLIYSIGSTWYTNPIVCSGHDIFGAYTSDTSGNPYPSEVFNNATALVDFGTHIDIWVMENVLGYSQMSRFRTVDKGANWTFIEQLTSGNYNHWDVQMSANYQSTKKGIIACVAQVNINYSDLVIKEI